MRIPERWDEIEAIAGGLLDASPGERVEQLAKLSTDPALKREVERLLRACDDAQSDTQFLASPAAEYLSPVLNELESTAAEEGPAPGEILARLRDNLSDRYEIEREVAEGGMATVFLARDMRHERHVAIKVMRPAINPGLGGGRFLREIRTLAGLSHPHILPLYDSGDADGLLYYVTPLIEGDSLRRRLANHRSLDVAEAIRLTREVASALAYAHRHGVVHRDIKPENILFQDGHAIVADFGIATAIDRATESGPEARTTDVVTPVWFMVGTPAYMAPEHFQGGATDHRVDLYALGVVAYEALTGERPVILPLSDENENPDAAHALITKRLRRANVPGYFSDIVATLLARRPEDRYKNADHLIAAVEPVKSSGGDRLRETKLGRRSGSAAFREHVRSSLPRRLRVRAGLVVAVAVAVLGAGAFAVSNLATASKRAGVVPLDPRKVAVAAFDPLNGRARDTLAPRIEQLVSDWLIRGLLQTQLVSVVPIGALAQSGTPGNRADQRLLDVARGAGVGLLVSGSHYLARDSLFLTARILDVETGAVRRAIGPVGSLAGNPLEAAELLRQAVMSTMGTLIDQRMANWANVASQPSNFAAYQAFADGLAAFFDPKLERDPQPFFLKAHALDTTFYTPLFWTYFTSGDSARTAYLVERRNRLPPWDRGMLDWITARNPEARYEAWRRIVDAAPQSEWLYMLAWTAMSANRPAVAVRSLQRLNPDRGWIREWESNWALLAQAHHVLGDYRQEHEVIRKGRERFPMSPLLVMREIVPLAGLGDEPGMKRKVLEMTYTSARFPSTWSFAPMIAELRWHGFVGLATETGDRLLMELQNRQAEMPANLATSLRLEYLWALRRWDSVGPMLDSLDAANSNVLPRPVLLNRRAMALAGRGNRADAFRLAEESRDIQRKLRRLPNADFVAEMNFGLTRASIHALLDEPEEAMTALRLVQADRVLLHDIRQPFDWPLDRLYDYPAFRDFARRHYDDPEASPERN